jgi:type II restriction/modification system DNA methylase subunit YeeA
VPTMAKIRVFDPACGSGNFLVIAYKEMRAIEAVINQRRGEADAQTAIPMTLTHYTVINRACSSTASPRQR